MATIDHPPAPLKSLDPEPIDSPKSNRYAITTNPPSTSLATTSAPALALRLGPESQIPDHASSMVELPKANDLAKANDFPAKANEYQRPTDFPQASDFPPRPNQAQRVNEYPQPNDFPPPRPPQMAPYAPQLPLDVHGVKSNCQHNLQQLMTLQRQRQSFGYGQGAVDLEWQIRNQTGILLNDLSALQEEVRRIVKVAKNHRWRRWLFGGFLASFIPAVRKLFRRGSDSESRISANNTEYAFRRSKGLLSRIKDSVLGHHHFASIAFFVFAILYVFQNEVTLRVAKTIQKRLRKLAARLEYGDSELDEKDVKLLEGWRWRVMLW